MKLLPLSQGKFAIVDDSDFDWLNQWKWNFAQGYAKRSVKTESGWRLLAMQNLIMNPPPGMEVDHKNLDKLDYQRGNLRIATKAQNRMNRTVRKDSSTGLKGVFPKGGGSKKFRAGICVNKKMLWIGHFPTPELAHVAYCQAALIYHGEFARTQ